jgi:hypothetical protein
LRRSARPARPSGKSVSLTPMAVMFGLYVVLILLGIVVYTVVGLAHL